MFRPRQLLLNSLLVLLLAMPAAALNVEPPLSNPQLETRAQNLFHEIRCVVCQGETIADSPAALAGDMRRLVRDKVDAGMSDRAIKEFLSSRYGDSILMRPPLKATTYALWFGPLALLLVAGLLARRYFKTQLQQDDA